MNRKRLAKLGVVAAALVMPASAAEGSHSRCRTCSSGGWYHFTSGRGMYVPYASKTVSPPAQQMSGRVIMPSQAATDCRPAVRYVRPCSGCVR